MREIVCQMMLSLDGRVDDPFAFVTGVAEDQYEDIDAAYATFDTVIVGRVTYQEMVAYWPGVRSGSGAEGAHARMAERMHACRKVVVTGDPDYRPSWNNAEAALVRHDADLVALAAALKAAPGKRVHLAGGAATAQAFVRLGLVDAYRLYVYPVVAPGKALFATVGERQAFAATQSHQFSNGVTMLALSRAAAATPPTSSGSFDALIT